MHARMQEVFAGFLTHTDAQIGRLLDFLRSTGQLDNTLVMVLSDNGASAEGGRSGRANEHRFTAAVRRDGRGATWRPSRTGAVSGTYNHYSWAWAWAGNTPLRLWKRYTWLGGTRTPLIVHWPAGIARAGRGPRPVLPRDRPDADHPRGVRRRRRPGSTATTPARSTAPASCRPSPTADAPSPARHAVLRDARLALDRDRAGGRRRPITCRAGCSTRSSLMLGSRDFADRPAGPCSTSKPTSRRRPTWPPITPTWCDASSSCGWSRPGRNDVLPMDDGLATRFGAMIFPAYPPGPAKTFLPGGRPDHRRGRAPAGRRVRHHGRRRGPGRRRRGACCSRWATGMAATPSTSSTGGCVSPSPRADEPVTVTADSCCRPANIASAWPTRRRSTGEGTFTLSHDGAPVGTARFARRAAVRPPARRDVAAAGF